MNNSNFLIVDSLDSAVADFAQGTTIYVLGDDALKSQLAERGFLIVDNADDCAVMMADEPFLDCARIKTSTRQKLVYRGGATVVRSLISHCECVQYGYKRLVEATKPDIVVCDIQSVLNNDLLAEAFAAVCVLDLAAFDLNFSRHMTGEKSEDEYANNVARLIDGLINSLEHIAKDKALSAAELTKALANAARLTAQIGKDALYQSGAVQVYEAIRMLFTAEQRTLPPRYTAEFLLMGSLIDYYMKNLVSSQPDLLFPPDNCRRIDALCEYFHSDIRLAAASITPIFPPIKMRLAEYRSEEFHSSHITSIANVKSRYSRALTVFKRLHSDDGFALKSMFDPTDISICLSLAPDVFINDSMLSFFKQTGQLEKYII